MMKFISEAHLECQNDETFLESVDESTGSFLADEPESLVRAVDVRRSAMDLLARREHSRRELIDKLSRKYSEASHELITSQIDQLQQDGLQSDHRMAEAFTRSRIRRGQGPVRIRMELKQKGIDEPLIEDTLDNITVDEMPADWSQLASEVAHRKYPNLDSAKSDLKFRGKVSRFLQQRGFTFEHISELF